MSVLHGLVALHFDLWPEVAFPVTGNTYTKRNFNFLPPFVLHHKPFCIWAFCSLVTLTFDLKIASPITCPMSDNCQLSTLSVTYLDAGQTERQTSTIDICSLLWQSSTITTRSSANADKPCEHTISWNRVKLHKCSTHCVSKGLQPVNDLQGH